MYKVQSKSWYSQDHFTGSKLTLL